MGEFRWFRRVSAAVLVSIAVLPVAACAPAGPAVGSDPVVIVAGAFGPQIGYEPMKARLHLAGFDHVSIYTIPNPFQDLHASAQGLASYVDQVLASTGSAKVDIVAHSQGGLLTRDYIKYLGGADKVDTFVALSGAHHGSDLFNLANLFTGNCLGIVSCQQFVQGSAYLTALNTPTEAIGSVHHVNITTNFEEIIFPYTSNFMYGPGDITNVAIQDQCPLRLLVGHVLLAVDGTTASGIIDALRKQPITLDCLAV